MNLQTVAQVWFGVLFSLLFMSLIAWAYAKATKDKELRLKIMDKYIINLNIIIVVSLVMYVAGTFFEIFK